MRHFLQGRHYTVDGSAPAIMKERQHSTKNSATTLFYTV